MKPILEFIESVCGVCGRKRVCFGYHKKDYLIRQILFIEMKATGSNSDIVEEVRSVDALPGHVGEDVRNVLLEMSKLIV